MTAEVQDGGFMRRLYIGACPDHYWAYLTDTKPYQPVIIGWDLGHADCVDATAFALWAIKDRQRLSSIQDQFSRGLDSELAYRRMALDCAGAPDWYWAHLTGRNIIRLPLDNLQTGPLNHYMTRLTEWVNNSVGIHMPPRRRTSASEAIIAQASSQLLDRMTKLAPPPTPQEIDKAMGQDLDNSMTPQPAYKRARVVEIETVRCRGLKVSHGGAPNISFDQEGQEQDCFFTVELRDPQAIRLCSGRPSARNIHQQDEDRNFTIKALEMVIDERDKQIADLQQQLQDKDYELGRLSDASSAMFTEKDGIISRLCKEARDLKAALHDLDIYRPIQVNEVIKDRSVKCTKSFYQLMVRIQELENEVAGYRRIDDDKSHTIGIMSQKMTRLAGELEQAIDNLKNARVSLY